MNYFEDCRKLEKAFLSDAPFTQTGGFEIRKFDFHSRSYHLLPGAQDYHCSIHDMPLVNSYTYYNEIGFISGNVQIKDVMVTENRDFSYKILVPEGSKKVKKIVFLFHGFNEKHWEKYLAMGKTICEKTGKAVAFFPIAFHMQRARPSWSEKRQMFELSRKRAERFPNILGSSLSNVAISMRLHSMPQRFIWSGLQTYYDVIQLIEECRAGAHPLIHKDFSLDIFAYSIGGFLAQILKLSNCNHYFDHTKVCLFCGGAAFNRMSPVSKFILDSEANVALYSYLIEHFDSFLQKDRLLHHHIEEGHLEGKVFHSLLDYRKMREFREKLFKQAENDFYAIALKKDVVIPTFEVINTLQGAFRDIHIKVDEFDFDYPYTHENPFPLNEKYESQVNLAFNEVFEKICSFLNG